MHVSDFLTETIGRLKLSDERKLEVEKNFSHDAQVIICPERMHMADDTGKPGSQLSGKGNATFYDPNVAISACGQQHYDNELIGAMNKEQYGKFANSDESPV
ncbi:5963_t:CDS:2 [Entrophospora sp. SA101]|nr:5963_t:CDS:2 [Entrophospora sp. SA101]